MLFPHIQSENEENFLTTHESDTSDMNQKDIYTSYYTFEVDDNVFVDDPFCNDYDYRLVIFDSELKQSVKLYVNSRSESDCEN